MKTLEQEVEKPSFWKSVKKGIELGYCGAAVVISTALGVLTDYLIRNDFIGQCELVRFTNDMSRRVELRKEYHDPKKERKIKQIAEGVVAGGNKDDPRGFVWLVDCTGLVIEDKDRSILYHTPKDMSKIELKRWVTNLFDTKEINQIYVLQGGLNPERDQEVKHFAKNHLEPTSMRIVYDVLKDLDLLDKTKYIDYVNRLERRPWISYERTWGRDFLFAEYNKRNGAVFYQGKVLRLPENPDLVDFRVDHLFRK